MTITKLSNFLLFPFVVVSCFQLFLANAATVHRKQEFDSEALDKVQTKELGIVSLDHEISRNSFPSDFVFGSATSAYQIEGGSFEDGKGPSCWDIDTEIPGKINDGSNGNVACDGYHKYEEDIDLLGSVGFEAYRFSISWSRIFPEGVGEQPNKAGLDHYNQVINKLLSKGIEPWVTLYHLDLPQALVDKHGGWFGREIVPAFAAYAEACFAAFGDRVKHWITINEPTVDIWVNCGFRGTREATAEANTPERRYMKGHNMLLGHAAAVKIYREKYQGSDGKIGIALELQWFEPLTNATEDIEAAEAALAFRAGWFLDPLFFGQYPEVINKTCTWGCSLPSFTDEERKLVKGSVDFLGVNYYSALYASAKPRDGLSNAPIFPVTMPSTIYVGDTRDGVPIGLMTGAQSRVYPSGLEKFLLTLKRQYGNPVTYITENGYGELREPGLSLEENLNDRVKIQFFRDHLRAVLAAKKDFYLPMKSLMQFLVRSSEKVSVLSFSRLKRPFIQETSGDPTKIASYSPDGVGSELYRKGADIRGFFVWSLLDDFELTPGYEVKFGLIYVDFQDGLKRYVKASALWFQQFLRAKAEKTEWKTMFSG